jgi:PAS domain-containing protein
MNPSVVMPSSIGSSGRPTPRIWKKWSITQIESKPRPSAWLTIRASVGPIASGPPGQVYELICRPTFMLRSVRRSTAVLVGPTMGHHAVVILRIVQTRAETVGGRASSDRLTRAAARVRGLETLILGWREGDPDGSAGTPAVVVTLWRDVESMVARVGADESGFLRDRLGLEVSAEGGSTYEVMSRTFGSLPTPTSVLRILTLGGADAGAGLSELLRDIQGRLTGHGLIASHVARRASDGGVEVVVVGVWIDHAAIERATSGRPERAAFADEVEPWIDSLRIETYDALEIAPRLPMASGPPILVLDGAGRVVDLTPAAAAVLGRTQDEAVGMLVEDLAGPGDAAAGQRWRRLLDDRGTDAPAHGEAGWAVPSGGRVILRWRLRRNVPVRGRHTILVRRRHEPEPTAEDLDAALAAAFPIDQLESES